MRMDQKRRYESVANKLRPMKNEMASRISKRIGILLFGAFLAAVPGLAAEQWTTLYSTDFSSDPHWTTSVPGQMFWDGPGGRYHVEIRPGPGQYAFVNIPALSTNWSFKFEFDLTMEREDYEGGFSVGLTTAASVFFSNPTAPAVWVNFGQGDGGNGATVGYRTDTVPYGFFPAPYQVLTTLGTTYHNEIIYDRNSQSLLWRITNLTAGGTLVGSFTSAAPIGILTGISRILVENVSNATAWGYLDNVSVSVAGDLVAYYKFNGNTNDDSGFANHCQLFGATFGPGQLGQAVQLSDNQFVTVTSSPSLAITGQEVTISAWVYPTNFWPGGKSAIVQKIGFPGSEGGYVFGIRENGQLQFQGIFDSGEWSDTNSNASSVPLNRWTHVAVSWDGQTVRYYQNGQPVGTTTFAGSLVAGGLPLTIGGIAPYYLGEVFYGRIDDLRIYNRALTASELSFQALSPALDLQVFAGLTISGVIGRNYTVEYTLDFSPSPTWLPLTNFALPTTPYLFFDTSAPATQKRFYRAFLTP